MLTTLFRVPGLRGLYFFKKNILIKFDFTYLQNLLKNISITTNL